MKEQSTRRGFTQEVVSAVNQNKSHSRMSLSGIFNVCCCKIEENSLLNKYVEDAGQQLLSIHLFNKNKKPGMTALYNNGLMARGFTLIELLVVVLIIGILAAVALPQYQKAVWKSRMTQAFTIGHTFLIAQQTYFLEHGIYATDLAALDIDLNIPNRFYAHCNTTDGHITIQDNKAGVIWDFYPVTQLRPARAICAVYNSATQASVLKAACQSITQDATPANWTSSNQTAYIIYL